MPIIGLFTLSITFFMGLHAEKLLPALTTSGGGLAGDKLCLYARAKWFAYRYNINFFYKPYSHFDQLVLHDFETNRFANQDRNYHNKLVIARKDQMQIFAPENNFFYYVKLSSYDQKWSKYDHKVKQNTIIISSESFAEVRDKVDPVKDSTCLYKEYSIVTGNDYFDNFYYAVKEDPVFLNQLRNLIKPKLRLNLISPPPKKISVALHVRKGGEFEFFNKYYPQEISLRVPADEYYIQQLIRLSEMLDNKPIYVYVFTNHTNPLVVVKKLKSAVNKKNITFDCRKKSSDVNILEDIFSMAIFDCLIRPTSSFSRVAQLIGDHNIIMYPVHGIWKDGKLTVNQIGVIVNK